MFKEFFLAGAAVAFMGSAAVAADIEAPPAAYDWSGFYIGGHLGYGEANYSGEFDESDSGSDTDPDPDELDLNGIAGGLQAGWNWQMDSFVLGVEADFTFTDWSDKINNNANSDESIKGNVDWLATLRLRAGLAADNLLFYVTGGGAIADAEYDATDNFPDECCGSDDNVDFDDIGLVVGGGAEWGLDENWTIRAEALYYIFNDEEDAGNLTSDPEAADDDVEFEDAWVVRGGVNFRFR
jgi:outer membrane immunogenic protein